MAGPVVAAAVIFTGKKPKGLGDSKQIDEVERERLALLIRGSAHVGVGIASAEEIDRINIRQATFLAMQRALADLGVTPVAALIDGSDLPPLPIPAEPIIDGDAHVPLIGAASIIAKTVRDALMVDACATYPGYGFARHKGYAVPEHRAALARLGPCAIHRRSFRPVAEALAAKTAA